VAGFDPPGDRLWGNQLTNLAVGTNNIMAVEVHNGGASSLDVTFGSSMGLVRALAAETSLRITRSNRVAWLAWEGSYLTLQQSTNVAGGNAWFDVSPPVTSSPYSVTMTNRTVFYRLRD